MICWGTGGSWQGDVEQRELRAHPKIKKSITTMATITSPPSSSSSSFARPPPTSDEQRAPLTTSAVRPPTHQDRESCRSLASHPSTPVFGQWRATLGLSTILQRIITDRQHPFARRGFSFCAIACCCLIMVHSCLALSQTGGQSGI